MSSLFGNDFPCCTTDPEDTAVSHVDEPQPPMPADCRNGHHSWTERGHGPCSACGEPSPPPVLPQLECGCLQGACHGGHTIKVALRMTDEELRRALEDCNATEDGTSIDEDVADLREWFTELLALRAYVTDHETRCNTLCPRCGDDIGTNADMAAKISELETWRNHARSVLGLVLKSRQVWCDKAIEQLGNAYAEQARLRARVTELEAERDDAPVEVEPEGYGDCTPAPMPPDIAAAKARIAELEAERPRFSQRQFIQAHRDRDEAQSRAAELAERVPELEAKVEHWTERAALAGQGLGRHVAEQEAQLAEQAATLDRIRRALAGHPRCEEHPEGDAIKCGWKRAVASVQAAVDAAPAPREPFAYVAFHYPEPGVPAFDRRFYECRAPAAARAAEKGPSYLVAELREVGER